MADYIEQKAAVKIAEKYGLANGSVLGRHTGLADCIASEIASLPVADVAPVVHGRCPICSGQKILTQDCYNDYSVEVDAESGEMSVWQGDACLTVISIDYCPNCGANMDGGADK